MPDIYIVQGVGVAPATITRYKDMGDGSHALVLAADVIDRANRDLGAARFIDENGVAWGAKHIDNKLRTASKPYSHDIAEGLVAGHLALHRYGHNGDVGTAWETIHDASTLRTYLAAAERLQIVSGDAADDGDPAGNGARTVTITGLDANYDALVETVTMNGTTNVLTDASFLRVLEMQVVTAGATGYNEGAITASNFADDTVLDQMDVQENQSHSACYTVPNGYIAYVTQAMVTEGSNKGSQFGLWIRPLGGLWTMKRTIILIQNVITVQLLFPMRMPAKTDFEIRAKGVLAAANVTAGFDGWIEEV